MKLLAVTQGIMQTEAAFLAIGQGLDETSWSIRGTINKENRYIPVFAAIRYHCANHNEDAQCWSLEKLIIDGVHSPIDTLKNGSRESSNAEDAENSTAFQIADRPRLQKTVEPPATSKVKANISPKQRMQTETSKPLMIWRTRSDNVNARSGPGLDTKVVFKMNVTTPLTLIEQRKHWGLFEYSMANDELGHVWIHMSMVQKSSE